MDEFQPYIPDWLKDVETESHHEKFRGKPHLEILFALKNNPEISEEYYFYAAVMQKDLNLSEKARTLANNIYEDKTPFDDFLLAVIESESNLRRIVDSLDWKWFEIFVESYLKHSEWKATRNFRFKSSVSKRSNLEIDVIGYHSIHKIVMLIDCKRYSSTAKSLVKSAAIKQQERCYQFKERLPDLYGYSDFSWAQEEEEIKIIPIIITWRDHGLDFVETPNGSLPIVYITQLFNFLLNVTSLPFQAFYLNWSVI